MKNIINDLNKRRKLIERLDFSQFTKSLGKMYMEIYNYESISPIIISLDDVIHEKKLLEKRGYEEPAVSNIVEQAAIGCKIMSHCTNKYYNVNDISNDFGIYDWNSGTTNRYLKKIKDKYILPFMDYLISEIEKKDTDITVDNVIHKRIKYFSNIISNPFFQETNDMIIKTSNLLNISDEVNWNTVASSCRDILISFSTEIERYSQDLDYSNVKKADFKTLMELIIPNKSRYTGTLIKLNNAIWEHVNSAVHKNNITKNEAIRIYIWTLMIISETEVIISNYNHLKEE